MFLQEIGLTNFRNYENTAIEVSPNLNLLIGDNAQGKTNLLESVYLAAVGKSHRTNKDQDLVRWSADFFRIRLAVNKGPSVLNLEINYSRDKRKQYKINGVPKNKLAELLGNFNAVLFAPEHLMLVKGSPQERRRFLDAEISQTNPLYYHNLQEYLRVVVQRNNCLKATKGKKVQETLAVWDSQLVETGIKLILKRVEVLKKLNPLARLVHRKITNGKENLEIIYKSTLGEISGLSVEEIRALFFERIKENFQQEIVRGFSLVGPHRDDLLLRVNDYELRLYGSQGQQRTTALALKMAELEFIRAETGQYPVLLLDDVMSELDYNRRMFLLESIQDRVQTFVTATGTDCFPESILKKARIFLIHGGQVCKEKKL